MKRAHPDSSYVSTMDSQHDTFSIGQSLSLDIKTSEPCIQFVYSDQDSVSTILLSLNLKQLDQLVKYLPLLKIGASFHQTCLARETLFIFQTAFIAEFLHRIVLALHLIV